LDFGKDADMYMMTSFMIVDHEVSDSYVSYSITI